MTDVQLTELAPETEYSISLRAQFGETISEPLEGDGLTRRDAQLIAHRSA